MAIKASSSVTLMMVSDGANGSDGKGILSIVHHYLVTNVTTGVTTNTTGWKTSPSSVTTTNKYLWYYQTVNYTTGSPTNTTPAIIGVYGDTGGKGETGKGISSVTPQYYLSTSNTAQSGGSWKTTQDTWSNGKYYWTRDAIAWNDGSTTYTTPTLATGLNNANSTANSAQTIAKQTASKFQWIVKSGSSATDFTLTDRTAQLVANNINLNGLVTFKGLDSSTQNAINTKVNLNQVQNYITSRGENLITNGTALYGDNTNFDGLTYDGSDTYYAGGSFKGIGTSTSGGTATTREFIPVDVASKYELSYYIKVSNTNARFYDFVSCYDIDKNLILANHVMWVSGSTTTLAKELKNGDTVVYLNSAKGFNSEVKYGYQKGFIFWNYKNSKGYSYGTETYSRNVYTNLWDDGASINKSNNTITLKSAWNHGAVASGTSVSQCSDGGNYTYLNSNFTVSSANTWVHKKGIISGVGKNNEDCKFREGTAFVKVGWLHNRDVNSSTCWLSTISFTQNGNVKANQSIIDNWAKDSIVNGETVINGGYIKTNTIKTDQLAVDDIFATGSAAMNVINAQEINANRITSGQLSAERINAYGLSVLNKDNNQQTFNITNNGEVTIKGSVSSSNYNIGKTGWSINNDGTAEFNDMIARGSVITNDGGIVSSGGSGRNLLKRYIRAGERATKIDDSSITVGVGSIGDTYFYLKPWVKLIKGKTYTISCDASNVPSSAPDWAFGVRVQGSSFALIINKNGRCYGTGVLDSDVGADAEIIVDNNSNPYSTPPNITLSNFKLEEGDVATDWSPAPEDKLKQVRFWAGTSFEERESAPFIVYSDGSIKATQGEYSGLWTGDIKIGNISIVDPSASSGNDALLTIQNGANGVKRVQLTDNTSSSFAQDVIITNNTYSPMISLKQDGSAYYSKGINIADKTTLNSTSLIINNKTLTTTSNGSGFLFSNELNVGTANQSANLIVHGNTLTDNITVDNTLYFGNVLKFTKNANGINIDFI